MKLAFPLKAALFAILLAALLAILSLPLPAQTCVTQSQVTLSGTLRSTNGLPAPNYAISLTPSQQGYIAGCGVTVATPVTCATSADGTVTGTPNPLTGTILTTSGSGTLTSGTYYVEFTWLDAAGHETLASPETRGILSVQGSLVVNPPSSGVPATAASMKVYIGTTSGGETAQGSVTPATSSYVQSVPLVSGSAVPASNTTLCQLTANDAVWPVGTGYNVSMTDTDGNAVPGYPMMWQLLGPGTSINLSNGLPYYHGVVYYPTPILTAPTNHGTQSISGPLSDPYGFTGPITGTGTFTGIANGTLNGQVGALAYTTPTTVSAPSQAAGIQAFTAGQEGSPGGTVPAGNYACVVTYNGAAGGETTSSAPGSLPSPASANSALYCAANDAPAGASSYNVYWQTGGTGGFYLGHANVAFGAQDAQYSAPPTSGTTPPSSNTATSIPSAAQAALGGNPGGLAIPYGVIGNPGDPAYGQTIFDYNTGSILQRFGASDLGSPQKSITGSVQNYGIYQDSWFPDGSLSASGQQFNGIGISIQQGGTGPVYGFGLPAFPATVGIFARNYRFGTNANDTYTENLVNWVGNQNANAFVAEWDCYNSSSGAATGDTGCTGLSLQSEGAQAANNGIFISGVKPWNNGFVIDDDSVNNAGLLVGKDNFYGIFNQSTTYQANNDAATSGTTSQAAPGIYWQSNVWNNTASVSDSFALYPSYGTGSNPVRIFNFAVPDPGSSGNTIWAFNGGIVRAVYNASFTGSGYFNADKGYEVNGTAGVTKTCTGYPTVVGGIVTSC